LPLGRGHEEEIINAIKEIYGLIGFLVGEMGSRASCKYTQGFTTREKAFWFAMEQGKGGKVGMDGGLV
jgi:hypothetical protein